MGAQVVTITPDGGISGLQRKKGNGLDLRKLGHAEIERASEITWSENNQLWLVRVLNERAARWMTNPPGHSNILKTSHWRVAVGTPMPNGYSVVAVKPYSHGDFWLGFDDYDDAVAAEVAFLDALRVRGIF